jgi:hypothetical protein
MARITTANVSTANNTFVAPGFVIAACICIHNAVDERESVIMMNKKLQAQVNPAAPFLVSQKGYKQLLFHSVIRLGFSLASSATNTLFKLQQRAYPTLHVSKPSRATREGNVGLYCFQIADGGVFTI